MTKIKITWLALALVGGLGLLLFFLMQQPTASSARQLSSGDDNSHWFHLSGTLAEITSDTLLVELDDGEERASFFDTTEIILDCSKCKAELEGLTEGEKIIFYFFRYNVDGDTVKVEEIHTQNVFTE